MQMSDKVLTALEVLRDAAENDFERHRIDVLERDLTSPPAVEQIDETHQRFDGVTYHRDKSGHYSISNGIHRAIWQYYCGEIPEGYDIHHGDFTASNNNFDNLQLLTKAEHRKIHNQNAKFGSQTKTCEYCGKTFVVTNFKHRFCSSACSANYYYKNNRVIKVCAVCGKEFPAPKKSKAKCCSPACTSKLLQQNNPAPVVEKECIYCHQKFTTNNPNKIYCSHNCALQIWRRKNSPAEIEKACPYCGKKFKSAKRKYCSDACCIKMQYVKKKARKNN